MPGFLITPKQFFYGIWDELKQDFVNWQLCWNDLETETVYCGEISGQVALTKEEIFSAQLSWGAKKESDGVWKKMDLKVEIPLDDHTGSSHEDGGCHFTPCLNRTVEFFLVPPGDMEQNEKAREEWVRAKQAALA